MDIALVVAEIVGGIETGAGIVEIAGIVGIVGIAKIGNTEGHKLQDT